METTRIAIIGVGNIGTAIARGLLASGRYPAPSLTLTRRKTHHLSSFKELGVDVGNDNVAAVEKARVIIIAVEPQQLDPVLTEIGPTLRKGHHVLVSVVTGATSAQIISRIGPDISVVRAMPNTAIAVGESMTCLSSGHATTEEIELTRDIFDSVGSTAVIEEEKMTAATALAACGVAFFLRAIRAASQGGIEIGFHSDTALSIAAQVARGSATLLLESENHPEFEIDRVTTPNGCTIAGLNRMEHEGFSSAMIKGITVSAERAALLYNPIIQPHDSE